MMPNELHHRSFWFPSYLTIDSVLRYLSNWTSQSNYPVRQSFLQKSYELFLLFFRTQLNLPRGPINQSLHYGVTLATTDRLVFRLSTRALLGAADPTLAIGSTLSCFHSLFLYPKTRDYRHPHIASLGEPYNLIISYNYFKELRKKHRVFHSLWPRKGEKSF